MPTMRFKRIALAQLFATGRAVAFGACVLIGHAQAQPRYVPPPISAATACLQSIQSLYRASTELHTLSTLNTKYDTFHTKHHSRR